VPSCVRVAFPLSNVRTQFSKDGVESFDSSVCWIVDDDIIGDDGVWVDLAAK
jgi:hypothetical protein